MKISSVRSNALRRWIEKGDASLLPPSYREKLAAMLTVLASISAIDELHLVKQWHIHPLSGSRAGEWSFSVSRNWRLTFRYEEKSNAIHDLDFEDHH